MLEENFKQIINVIKSDIKESQLKTAIQVNNNLIGLYFRLGKILYDNYKYGNKFIDEVARELKLGISKYHRLFSKKFKIHEKTLYGI